MLKLHLLIYQGSFKMCKTKQVRAKDILQRSGYVFMPVVSLIVFTAFKCILPYQLKMLYIYISISFEF